MQAVLEGMSERTSDIWSFLSPVDLVASCLIRTSWGFRSILPLKPLLYCSASNPSFAAVPRMKDHIMCCVCKFCTSHCFLCILLGSPIRTLCNFILPGENYDVAAVQNVCIQPQLTAGFPLCFLTGVMWLI